MRKGGRTADLLPLKGAAILTYSFNYSYQRKILSLARTPMQLGVCTLYLSPFLN